jgi:hypothetical protein
MRQQRHVENQVQASGLDVAHPKSIPITTALYNDFRCKVVTDTAVISQYKSLVGALQLAGNHARPNTAFPVSCPATFVNAPTAHKYARVKDVICYLKGTPSYGLHRGGDAQECRLHAYCDSDYENCRETHRFATGPAMKCGVGSVS